MAEFDTTPVDIFIMEAETSPVRLHVNGHNAVILVGVDAEIQRGFLPALDDCASLRYRIVGEEPPTVLGVEPADPDFDPEAVIDGTVDEVNARLAGLTPSQLEAVLTAENDREVSRVGVTRAIEKAIAETN